MTETILGRPRRSRPTDRVNYKLDSDLRALLTRISERQGRNEGSQVEQLILFYEAYHQLNAEGVTPTLSAINVRIAEIQDSLIKDTGASE
jgi:hypothetical protein